MSTTITFNSLKGGVGKTTCAILFARVLRKRGYSVLMIDLDPQYSLTSYYYDGEPPPGRSIVDYLSNRKVKINDAIIPAGDIWLLGSSVELIDYNVARRLRHDSYALQRRLLRDRVTESFDYIVIDTPPTFSFLNSLALPVADELFLVTAPEIWSVRAVGLYLETLRQFTESLETQFTGVHVVVNRFAKRRRADVDTLAALERMYGEYYVGPPIPFSLALRNFLLYKKNYKNHFHRVEKPLTTIVNATIGVHDE